MATADPLFDPILTFGTVTSVTTTYSATDADAGGLIVADASGGAFTVTIPSAVGRKGAIFTVKRISAANTVTVKSVAGTLDGTAAATGIALDAQFKTRSFRSDGTNYHIVGAVG